MTIMPCKGCTQCRNHLNKIFNPKKSESFKWIKPDKNYFDW